ncbi:Regucalcin [Frankliniella fusca]|uniref:Regucalcin n=1 Tax=Frankliniella fusca TaxID=407009 RepID=A0AAE1HTF6_9NEOP|nr:Regucalcin [Frankliniella fusca]
MMPLGLRVFLIIGACVGVLGVSLRQLTEPGLHTEGPVWDPLTGGLYFVDIAADRLLYYDPKAGDVHGVTLDGPVSPVLVLPGGDLVVGVGRQLRRLDWAALNFSSILPLITTPEILATVEKDKPGNRFNDGNVDTLGRVWIGTMGPEPVVGQVTPDQGSLYRITVLSRSGHLNQAAPTMGQAVDVTTVLRPVSISNGLVWNREQTLMYYIDTPTRRVDVFDFNLSEGTLGARSTAFDFEANNVTGNPDGMTIDADGNLWVACFGGSQVIKVDPHRHTLLDSIAIPASQVTSVELGGPLVAGGDTLYVTSMRKGLSEDELAREPLAGAVFALTGLGVCGQRNPSCQ